MFDFFKKKKFSFSCPMCTREYFIKFDPTKVSDFNYEFAEDCAFLAKETCGFCKAEFSVVFSRSGEIATYDEKWERIKKEHYDKLDPIENEISDIEDQLHENPNNVKLKEKLSQLESKKDKLEESFEKKEENYSDRQANWQDKWVDKLEKMK